MKYEKISSDKRSGLKITHRQRKTAKAAKKTAERLSSKALIRHIMNGSERAYSIDLSPSKGHVSL